LSSGRSTSLGGDHRNQGRREGGLLELPVKVNSPNLPLTKSLFQMQRVFLGLRGLGKLTQIGALGQVKPREIVDQVCGAGGVEHRNKVQTGRNRRFYRSGHFTTDNS
jgi:hypothetical protein